MTVGLNSSVTEFDRLPLNLVIVVDISGSMGSSFNEYYTGEENKKPADKDQMKSKVDLSDLSSYTLVVGNCKGLHLGDAKALKIWR
jgi:Ca-activated chloride channel family protein